MGVSELRAESDPTDFLDSLTRFSKEHRAQRWEGTFGDFLTQVLPGRPAALFAPAMNTSGTCCSGTAATIGGETTPARRGSCSSASCSGSMSRSARVVDYFKAAAAGSDVGRRLLLLLGPPSGGKSTLAILLEAGARGIQPHRRGRPVRDQGLAAARIAVESRSRRACARSFAKPMASTSRGALALGPRLPRPRMRRRLTCAYPSSAFSSPRRRAAESAPTRRTTRPTADIADLVGSVDLPRSRRSAMKATRGPGPGRARCTPPAAACSR